MVLFLFFLRKITFSNIHKGGVMDAIRKPSVETLVKIGNFELTVVAYRAITRAEANMAARQYLINTKRRAFPKTGKGKLVTIIGHDGL